ncbi:Uncharacterized protein dnm_013330 [Desulfonema magnum]|uniref:Uncharacterized protein n=1 Tax=Desulfonema magnum TaxID=45655 RepID=A0A975BHE1_9BACT|nr:Uncharacterized protein dnm_013330 [Desulfonema magnum]
MKLETWGLFSFKFQVSSFNFPVSSFKFQVSSFQFPVLKKGGVSFRPFLSVSVHSRSHKT